jgi:hypothetical protein
MGEHAFVNEDDLPTILDSISDLFLDGIDEPGVDKDAFAALSLDMDDCLILDLLKFVKPLEVGS